MQYFPPILVLFILYLPSHLADFFIRCQVLYVMELRQDLDKGKAGFTAVSEFLLTHPVLSFGVRDVSHSRMRHTEVLPAEEESESMSTGVYPPTQRERLKNEIKKTFNFNVPHFFHVFTFIQRELKDKQSQSLGSRLNSTVSTPSKFSVWCSRE